jgi:peptide/nickel transport system substrate-binding protein
MNESRYRLLGNRVSRRRAIGGVGLIAGAAAFAAACGGGSQPSQPSQPQGQAGTGGQQAAQAGAVAKIAPGHYSRELAASQEEIDEAKNAKRGGTLRFRYLDPPHFDPGLSYSCTIYDTAAFVYNKAIREKGNAVNSALRLELEPDLAEKWEQTAPDGSEYTLSFRKNVKFQNRPPVNGRPFTAEDVKLIWERYQSTGVQKDYFALVDRIEMPDQHTLRVKLKEPFVDFIPSVATYAYIIPRELWMNSDGIRTQAVGTGPFIRESWRPKEGSVFIKNPDYWEMAPDGKPYPYLERIEAVVNDSQPTRKALFRSGELDQYVAANIADAEDLIKTTPNTVWFDVPQTRGGNVNGITFNYQNPKFRDKRLRNALSMAIDRVAFDALLYDGLNEGYTNTSLPWFYFEDKQPTLQQQGANFQFNQAEARKLLQAAGAENLEFELVEFYMTSGANNTFEPLQDMLRQVGVRVVNRRVDNPTAIQTITQRNYREAVNVVWGPPNFSADGWIYSWYVTNGGTNYNFLSDPELDNLLRQQRRELDTNRRKGILRQIDQRLNDQNYDIWWPQGWQLEMWPVALKNFRTHGFMGSMTCYSCGQLRASWLDR